MKTYSPILFMSLVFVVCSFGTALWAHDWHNKNTSNSDSDISTNTNSVVEVQAAAAPLTPGAGVSEFPTLHPLIVHFPIMLIILAAVLQLISLAVSRKEFDWLILSLALVGAVTAWLSSNPFHPHTTGLNENAQRILMEHELYASFTFWLAVSGLAVKALSNFVLKRVWWSEIVATLLLIGSGVAVAIAGHHGAELVHKEGVGPRGDFLETH